MLFHIGILLGLDSIFAPLSEFLRWIALGLFHLGGLGLLILGILDSSFLTMPLGNDLLMIALSARRHERMPYYAAAAAAGSVLGCLIVDLMSRKAEKQLAKIVSRKRLKDVERQVGERAGWAVAFAALMPPPFPFTPFVAAAAALGYPRNKLLGIIGAARLVRFSVDGVLAIVYGRKILLLAEKPAVEYSVFALIAFSLGLSGLSIYRWVKRTKPA